MNKFRFIKCAISSVVSFKKSVLNRIFLYRITFFINVIDVRQGKIRPFAIFAHCDNFFAVNADDEKKPLTAFAA